MLRPQPLSQKSLRTDRLLSVQAAMRVKSNFNFANSGIYFIMKDLTNLLICYVYVALLVVEQQQ